VKSRPGAIAQCHASGNAVSGVALGIPLGIAEKVAARSTSASVDQLHE
jgi:hypothetical protein